MGILERIKTKAKILSRWALIILCILLSISLIRNIFKIMGAKDKVNEAAMKVEKIRQENEELKKEVERVGTVEFVEKEARNKLGLAKAGEIVVVLPDEEILRKFSPKFEEEEETLPDPNWKKWLKLFL